MHCLISGTNESNRLLKVRKRTRKRTRTKYSNCKTSNFNKTDILKLPRKSDSIRKFQSTSMTSLIKLNTEFKRSELDDDNEDEEENLEQVNEGDEHFISFNRLQNIYLGNIMTPTISYNGKVQQSDLSSQSAKKLEAPIERFLVKSALNKSQRTSNNNKTTTTTTIATTTTTFQEIRRKMSPSSSSIKLFLTTSLCLLLTSFKPNQIACQRSMSVSEPSIQFTSQSPLIPPPNGNNNNNYNQAASERRLNDGIPQLKPQANAIDQLMSILNSYQQSAMQNQNRRPILPFNNQRNISPALQTSTPLNPFIGVQFQPNRQRQGTSFPNQQQQPQQQPQINQMTNTNQLFVPSSPATPYLTLNRIASLANNAQTMNNNNNNNGNNINNNNQQQNSNLNTRSQLAPNLQPINTIPLGGASNNQQQGRLPIGSRLMPQPQPTRGVTLQRVPDQQHQPANLNQNGQQQRPTSMSLPLPPTVMVNPNPSQVKPISGFAPSGPPPNAAANNALVVVQSPTNAIGQLAPNQQQQQDLSDNNKANSESVNTTTSFAPTTTLNPTAPTASDDSSNDTSSGSDDKQAQPSTPAVAFTTSLKPPPFESGSPTITPSNTDNQDNKQAASEQQPVTKDSTSWNPVEGNRSELGANRKAVSLSPSPDIVTVPPGYNPDNPNNQPQNYDIAVSAQMGTPVIQVQPQQRQDSQQTTGSNRQQQKMNSSSESSTSVASDESASTQQQQQQTSSTPIPITAPTAITTITWSPPPSTTDTYSTISTSMISSSSRSIIQPTKSFDSPRVQQTASPDPGQHQQPPTRIRDNSLQQTQQSDEPMQRDQDLGVVYGKPQTRDSKPIAPSPVTNQANIETSVAGRPFIQPVQMDNQVRPFTAGAQQTATNGNAGAQQQTAYRSNHGHSPLNSSPPIQNPFLAGALFRGSRPLNGGSGGNQSPMSVGSGFTITANGNQTMPTGDIQDYVAGQPPPLLSPPSSSFQGANNEPTISAQGGPDPASFDLSQQDTMNSQQVRNSSNDVTSAPNNAPQPSSSQATPPRIRRPTFKPKPAVPPIRIDSCIVGDDSSCDQSHNERCVTEYGISSCHCKPGYARLSQLRGYCSPVSSLQMNMKIDKLSDDRKLVFNHTLDNSNSEEYQYLEFETIQALASAFQQTQLAKQFMGARVNKFFDKKGKVWANVSVNFEANNMTKAENKIQQLAGQELLKIINQSKQKPLGDSTIMLDGSKEAVSRLQDLNECSNKDLNDCSKFATCSNEFGGFQCQCLPGYEDKYTNLEDKSKHGRVCLGCSASYCSNRGECSISDGQKHCKCRPNFIGARCDIDSEVLAVAIGGSLVGIIILIITFWCLFVFNRRWKREQQKMDAMSATSGLTFNYVNSSTNSLMSPPSARNMVGGLHRSGGHQVGAMAANYGHRFSAALTNAGTRGGGASNGIIGGGQHYANDQQAIIGSTSSGSSASSQAIGCNPYAPAGGAYQYEDGGLLIAPASTGSSEQTSPSSNSYRGIINGGGNNVNNTMLSQLAGNAYTLSGHHHHHHHAAASHHAQQLHHHHHHHAKNQHHQLTQFNPAGADYRTLNTTTALHYPAPNHYDARWRTLQDQRDKQSALVGYYLVR